MPLKTPAVLYNCDIGDCSRVFERPYHLKQHKMSHLFPKERELKCPYTDEGCIFRGKKSDIVVHMANIHKFAGTHPGCDKERAPTSSPPTPGLEDDRSPPAPDEPGTDVCATCRSNDHKINTLHHAGDAPLRYPSQGGSAREHPNYQADADEWIPEHREASPFYLNNHLFSGLILPILPSKLPSEDYAGLPPNPRFLFE